MESALVARFTSTICTIRGRLHELLRIGGGLRDFRAETRGWKWMMALVCGL